MYVLEPGESKQVEASLANPIGLYMCIFKKNINTSRSNLFHIS